MDDIRDQAYEEYKNIVENEEREREYKEREIKNDEVNEEVTHKHYWNEKHAL